MKTAGNTAEHSRAASETHGQPSRKKGTRKHKQTVQRDQKQRCTNERSRRTTATTTTHGQPAARESTRRSQRKKGTDKEEQREKEKEPEDKETHDRDTRKNHDDMTDVERTSRRA